MTSFRATYDFLAPARIVFGWGRRQEVGSHARGLGKRAFLFHGVKGAEASGGFAGILDGLRNSGIEVVICRGAGREPLVEDVDQATEAVLRADVRSGDFVVGLGGGSTIDLAKAVAALATNRRSPTVKDYLEGVGAGLAIDVDPLPFLAMPTTAGTGSEATKNAVVSGRNPAFKKSLRSDRMMARVVLVDPELTVSVPPEVTAATGMDAVTQLIESYVSSRAAPIPRALALDGLVLAAASLERAFRNGGDREAREMMAHAALLGGMALANSGLGMAHGVAAALGIHAGVPHGVACAMLLPAAMRANRGIRLEDFGRLGEVLCGRRFASASEGADAAIDRIDALAGTLRLPSKLREVGVRAEELPAIVKSSAGSSMSGNPRPIPDAELGRILEDLL